MQAGIGGRTRCNDLDEVMTLKPDSTFENTITPMLCVRDAAGAIAWYTRAFGAAEIMRLSDDTRITHCEMQIGGATIMLADEFPEIDVLSPESVGGTPVMLLLEVEDVDAFFAHAVASGATSTRAVAGDMLRNGKLTDPYGHSWMIMTRRDSGPELA
jgi:PhnB protein